MFLENKPKYIFNVNNLHSIRNPNTALTKKILAAKINRK